LKIKSGLEESESLTRRIQKVLQHRLTLLEVVIRQEVISVLEDVKNLLKKYLEMLSVTFIL
jgi:hypothetical protein